jgi:hypothetical protein
MTSAHPQDGYIRAIEELGRRVAAMPDQELASRDFDTSRILNRSTASADARSNYIASSDRVDRKLSLFAMGSRALACQT